MGCLSHFLHTNRHSWQDVYCWCMFLQSIHKIKFRKKKKNRLLFGQWIKGFINIQQSMSSLACWGKNYLKGFNLVIQAVSFPVWFHVTVGRNLLWSTAFLTLIFNFYIFIIFSKTILLKTIMLSKTLFKAMFMRL